MALIIISVGAGSEPTPTNNDSPPLKRGARGDLVVIGSLSRFQIPLNPPFLKGEISHNDLDGTTIKAAKIYKTGGLEIKVHSEGCLI